jgi:molybdopterin molybdotransferase
LASWLAFEVLVRPAIWKLAGRRHTSRPILPARLAQPLSRQAGRTHFVPAQLRFRPDAEPLATPLTERPSGLLPSASLADGLILYPEQAPRLNAGDRVEVAWLQG